MSFSSLGLSEPIVKAVNDLNYASPTAIQQRAIPAVLAGRDLIAAAATGTGKTASFVLPMLQLLGGTDGEGRRRRAKRLRGLILVPTRELALQVVEGIERYAVHTQLRAMAVVGGVDSAPQCQQLLDGVDIVVATPGRLLDLAQQRAVHFDELQMLVLDEADRMLDMGFIGDINKIVERLPALRQNLLFSATLSEQVRGLARTAVEDAVEVSVIDKADTAPAIEQWLVAVDKDKKSALLSQLITELQWTQGLIFIRTKHGAAKLVDQLAKRGINAEAIHSGRSQASRSKVLEDFKSGAIGLLVATGIAARGLDIDDLARVINYDLPDDADDYIHRIGRTGRAGASGEAVSLVSRDDFKRLCAIERRQNSIIERREIEGFVVGKELPASDLNYVVKPKLGSKPRAKSKPRSKAETGHKSGAGRSNPRSAKPAVAKSTGASSASKAGDWSQWMRDKKS